MTDEPSPHDIKTLWQNQAMENVQMSLAEVRQEIHKLQSGARWRNIMAYAALAFIIPAFSWQIYAAPNLIPKIGPGLVVIGAIYVAYQRHKRAWPQPAPSELGLVGSVSFYSDELKRQRDISRSAWRWFAVPLLPGWILIVIGGMLYAPLNPKRAVITAIYIAVCSALLFLGRKLQKRRASKLQRKIDDLGPAEE